MTFAGVNYWAILIAAVVAWLAGGVWYTALSKPWMAAQGFTAESMAAAKQRPGAYLPFIYSFVADLAADHRPRLGRGKRAAHRPRLPGRDGLARAHAAGPV